MGDEREGLMSEAKSTTNHEKIRSWVEERGGKPAAVKGTGSGDDPGILRIDFPGYTGEESLRQISWEQFFEKFEKEQLAFLFQEETKEGNESRFSKLTNREDPEKVKRARTN
jgi:hypothetical protein